MALNVKNEYKVLNVNGITPFQQMASSCSGALLVSLFMTPLDVVRIRLQAQDRLMSKKCFLYSNGVMDHILWKTNGEPPVALHTAKEICNCKWYTTLITYLELIYLIPRLLYTVAAPIIALASNQKIFTSGLNSRAASNQEIYLWLEVELKSIFLFILSIVSLICL